MWLFTPTQLHVFNNLSLIHSREKLEGLLKTIILGKVWVLIHMNKTPLHPSSLVENSNPMTFSMSIYSRHHLLFIIFCIQCLHITSLGQDSYIISKLYITKHGIKYRDVTFLSPYNFSPSLVRNTIPIYMYKIYIIILSFFASSQLLQQFQP
jgi:hypothetical protein